MPVLVERRRSIHRREDDDPYVGAVSETAGPYFLAVPSGASSNWPQPSTSAPASTGGGPRRPQPQTMLQPVTFSEETDRLRVIHLRYVDESEDAW